MVKCYTDGACFPNPGFGGWAFLIMDVHDIVITDTTQFYCGGKEQTTSNAMELTAILECLRWCEENGKNQILIYSDSKYAGNASNDWCNVWAKNGWKNKLGDTVANIDLVKQIYDLKQRLKFKVEWVPGHSGNPFNDFVDGLANKMALRFQGKEFARFEQVDLTDKLSIRGQSYKVTAKFVTSGIIVLNPMFNKKLRPVILGAKEFDEQEYILL